MKILLFTSSARGHALADALARSRHEPEIIAVCPSRNPGIARLASELFVKDLMDFEYALALGKKHRPDFVVIGPEDPICGGLASAFREIGIPCVAPSTPLARLESSKEFARDLIEAVIEEHGIDANPRFRAFTSRAGAEMKAYIEQELGGEYVVKYDALKGGRGVKLSGEHLQTIEEGVAYAQECIDECGKVVIEEKLVGQEFSLISFASGKRVVDTPAVQDHKRAYDGDLGPNTGGMGTYSDANHSLPFLKQSDLARASEINAQVAEALYKECGEPYKGFLYGGFIAVPDGVRVIEYNCRFGDPEALNVLPLLTSDFVDICVGIIEETLEQSAVSFENKATVCKYIVPESYPVSRDQVGERVVFPEVPENARIYYGDVREEEGSLYLGGSRTAGIVGIGDTIEEAEQIAQELCERVEGPVRFRSDIGKSDLARAGKRRRA